MSSRSSIKCNYCGYEWVPRVESPKACPECKRRLRGNGFRSLGEDADYIVKGSGDMAESSLGRLPVAPRAQAETRDISPDSESEIEMQGNGKPPARPEPGTSRFRAMVKFAEQYKKNPSDEELDSFMEKGW